MDSVRNIMAIAGKELRGYFASPIAYILIGLFALLFGAFFYVFLTGFAEQQPADGDGRRRRPERQRVADPRRPAQRRRSSSCSSCR